MFSAVYRHNTMSLKRICQKHSWNTPGCTNMFRRATDIQMKTRKSTKILVIRHISLGFRSHQINTCLYIQNETLRTTFPRVTTRLKNRQHFDGQIFQDPVVSSRPPACRAAGLVGVSLVWSKLRVDFGGSSGRTDHAWRRENIFVMYNHQLWYPHGLGNAKNQLATRLEAFKKSSTS